MTIFPLLIRPQITLQTPQILLMGNMKYLNNHKQFSETINSSLQDEIKKIIKIPELKNATNSAVIVCHKQPQNLRILPDRSIYIN